MDSPMDRKEAIEFLKMLHKTESPLALACLDLASDREILAGGYIWLVSDQLLGIETFDDAQHMILIGTAPDFFFVNPDDAPPRLKAVSKASFNFGIQFRAENWLCCVLGRRPEVD